ncbi:Transcriptional activator protein raiR [Rhodovulum sp. P5]|uniref:helix-turn-helix transcriptional regulator n=1 Tax=Rhodovulum sp. P5 TaxID=1564506 RepID=UPI0009C1BD71|nr:LuxR family transcriptional regulator [Rhodovulum sp. P5]ARE38749.1 Transcriptional activator protein raiR [Rhodovulum sp. P5]
MDGDLDSFLDRLQRATTLEHLYRATEELRDYYGVLHVVYHWVSSVGDQYGAGTYSTEWVDRYLERGYVRVDPVVSGCLHRFHPVNWKQLDWSSKAARDFLTDAIAHGVGNQGYSIPVHGPSAQFAVFTVSDSCSDEEWETFVKANMRDLILIAHDFNRKALEFEQGDTPAPTTALSPREVSAMTLLAQGMSRAQAAQELSISEHTLRVYIEAARHKLGALNTTHAVARALSSGLIAV